MRPAAIRPARPQVMLSAIRSMEGLAPLPRMFMRTVIQVEAGAVAGGGLPSEERPREKTDRPGRAHTLPRAPTRLDGSCWLMPHVPKPKSYY
jgi:hypothetical protein